jgi:predicted nucleic acid-binding protein
LASAKESRADFLVSLDKKHLLALNKKFKKPQIVSSKDLIEKLLSKDKEVASHFRH